MTLKNNPGSPDGIDPGLRRSFNKMCIIFCSMRGIVLHKDPALLWVSSGK